MAARTVLDPVLRPESLLKLVGSIQEGNGFFRALPLHDQVRQKLVEHKPSICGVGDAQLALRVLVSGSCNAELTLANLEPLADKELSDPVEDGAVGFLLRPTDAGVVVDPLGQFARDAAVSIREASEVGPHERVIHRRKDSTAVLW